MGRRAKEGSTREQDRIDYAWATMVRLGLGEWTFRVRDNKSTAGKANCRQRIIVISRDYLEQATDKAFEEVLIHEIAHGLVGHKAGHGPVWQMKMGELGIANPERCSTMSEDGVIQVYKWHGVCPGCHKMRYGCHRMTKRARGLACSICLDEHCGGKYDKKFRLEWTEANAPAPPGA